jgi:hypothetical protein
MNLNLILDNYSQFVESFTQITEHADLIFTHNDYLKDQLEKEKEKIDYVVETHSEIFNMLSQCLTEDNRNLVEFMMKIPEHDTEVKQILQTILTRNEDLFKNDKFLPIYEYVNKPAIRSFEEVRNSICKTKDDAYTKKKTTTNFGTSEKIKLNYLNNNNFQEIYNDFNTTKSKIPVKFPIKKVIKIINTIYFEMLEKIYFKKDQNNFELEEGHIEFPQVLSMYFIQSYGLDSLAKKKFLELLQAIKNFESQSKRISLFKKIIAIDKTAINKTFFDGFVTRHILILIQKLKYNKCFLKNKDENNNNIFVITNKLPEIISLILHKFGSKSDFNQNILNYIEMNKKAYTKNMKSYSIIDFDDFIEFVAKNFIILKNNFSENLKKIFSALDVS